MRLIKYCFAAGMLIAATISGANAVPFGQKNLGVTGPTVADKVHWVCGPRRCVWKPDYRGEIAVFARGWAAPKNPKCVWEKRPAGWVHICP